MWPAGYINRERNVVIKKIEQIYNRYGPMVYRCCFDILKNEAQAKDAMHDVFIRLLKNKTRLDLETPSSLLYRIATNISLNKLRDGKRMDFGYEYEPENLTEEIALANEFENRILDNRIIELMFKDKKESTRVMALMHWVEGFTLDEVAEHTGISRPAVKKRLQTLKAQLKTYKGDIDA